MMPDPIQRPRESLSSARNRGRAATGRPDRHVLRSACALMVNTLPTCGGGVSWLLAVRLDAPAQVGVICS
jgi:hypothetical protein